MKRLKLILPLLACLLFGFSHAEENPSAYLLEIDGAIGPATSDYFERTLLKAQEKGGELIILRMDTPGGLDTSMRKINKAILSSSIPVVTFIAPDGARAASAGTYILYASHIAAMAPATHLGAATPVRMGGGFPGTEDPESKKDKNKSGDEAKSPKDAMSQKALNDARAYIRGLAQKRDRNVQWAEKAVVKADSLSAREALKINVINLIANDLNDLMTQLNGWEVVVLDQKKTLNTAKINIIPMKPDWRSRLLSVLSNPNIAYILLLIGIYGLIFEFMNPGFIVPGVVGAICLLLGLYALHVLPVNYAGAALLILGIALMVIEAFVPSFGALGIGGIVAFLMGSLMLIDSTEFPEYQISRTLIFSFTLISGVFFILVVGMAVKARRRRVVSGSEEMIAASGEAMEDFQGQGKVFVHGEIWDALSEGPLRKGQAIQVVERKGLILQVQPLTSDPLKEK